MYSSLSSTDSNKGTQILKFFETKDCKNMILTILRWNILKKFNNLTICASWDKLQAVNFAKSINCAEQLFDRLEYSEIKDSSTFPTLLQVLIQ